MAMFGGNRVVSKFKNVYCDNPNPDVIYTNLRVSSATGEQNYIQCNSKFFCFATSVSNCLISILILQVHILRETLTRPIANLILF